MDVVVFIIVWLSVIIKFGQLVRGKVIGRLMLVHVVCVVRVAKWPIESVAHCCMVVALVHASHCQRLRVHCAAARLLDLPILRNALLCIVR